VIAAADQDLARTEGGLQVDMPSCRPRVLPRHSSPRSKDHNIVLRGLAKDRGLKINEYGVFRLEDSQETMIAGRTEQEVYDALDLAWIPPELREARREFEWAKADTIPKLLDLDDLRGDLHMHTTEPMAKPRWRKWSRPPARSAHIDHRHSKRVSMARGSTPPGCGPSGRLSTSSTRRSRNSR
jgi:hypothetical protein